MSAFHAGVPGPRSYSDGVPGPGILLTIALLLAAARLRGEAVAIEAARSPFCLVAESVSIGIGKDMVLVEGDYDYKYVRRYDSAAVPERISFSYAVFAPKTAEDLEDLNAITQARLHVGSLDFEPAGFLLPGETTGATAKAALTNSRLVFLVFQIPRGLLRQQCRLHISHYQMHDHYAGKTVVAYLPLLPDFETLKNELLFSQSDFTVAFEVVDAVQLHRLSANRAVYRETPQQLTLHPVDHESIVVEVTASRGK